MNTAVTVGTLSSPRMVYLGYVPVELQGLLVRALYLVVGKAVPPNPQNHWVLQLGLVEGETFTPLREVRLVAGVKTVGGRFPLPGALRVSEGVLLALKAVHRGMPAPIEDLSLVLETGILGQR